MQQKVNPSTFWGMLVPELSKILYGILLEIHMDLDPFYWACFSGLPGVYMSQWWIQTTTKYEFCQHYSPAKATNCSISLINVDLKIICKGLSKRLEKITPLMIHPDQIGFIKGGYLSTNICRLLNLLDYSCSKIIETTILLLDAEKSIR